MLGYTPSLPAPLHARIQPHLPHCMLGYTHPCLPHCMQGYTPFLPHYMLGYTPPCLPHYMLGYAHPLHCMLGYTPTPWIKGMAHACENITFPQLLLWAVIKVDLLLAASNCSRSFLALLLRSSSASFSARTRRLRKTISRFKINL